jgi:hypothetical protein
MSVITNNLLLGDDGYQISRSVRLRSSASAYFNRTPASAGNRQKFTVSVWYKAGGISSGAVNANIINAGGDGSSLLISGTGAFGATYQDRLLFREAGTTLFYWPMVFRDPSAWYHIVFAMDTTQATAANRAKLYVNGVDQGAFSGTAITQNTSTSINNTSAHYINTFNGTNYPSDLYYTEYNFIDGQALTPSSFGETDSITGVWKPKKYAGTYGTNGFYLNFSDPSAATAAAIGKDYSGNGNNWTPNNISVTTGATYDSMLDVPTMYADGGNGRGNYCVMNPLDKGSSGTISDGNLATSSQTASANGTFGLTTGKWYFEASFSSITGASSLVEVGIQATNIQGYLSSGNKDLDTAQTAYGATYTTSDIIGCAFDLDAKQMTFYKNGTSQGTFTYTVADTYFPMIRARGTTTFAGTINFGQRPFTYTPPTGFKALNTQNLPDATIKKGNAYFDATTYTGNGSTQSITNSGSMQPDFIWFKSRTSAAYHALFDSVRGRASGLSSNATDAEQLSVNAGDNLVSFNSNGFTVGSMATAPFWNSANGNTLSLVAWQWKESASAGFDIVTYTGDGTNGRTVSHALGVVPKMVIVKSRSTATNWIVKHASLSSTNTLELNSTAAQGLAGSGYIGDLSSSTTFTLVNGGSAITNVNGNGTTYVAYLFAEVAGYSKFGSYTGNGSTDGVFVYCGFRPRFIMIKRTDTTSNWIIKDTARSAYNAGLETLYPNLSNAEGAGETYDVLSNGFKLRSTSTEFNASGGTYIFMALAENPFKNSLAR